MLRAAQHIIAMQSEELAKRSRIQANTIVNTTVDAGMKEAERVAQDSNKSDAEKESLLAQALGIIKDMARNAARSAKEIKSAEANFAKE
jgi:fructose-specific phosphotransferase system component IIB